MTRPVLRASAPDVVDIKVVWVREGWLRALSGDVRYVQTGIPADSIRQTVRNTAKSLAGSMVAMEEYRARLAFGLQR